MMDDSLRGIYTLTTSVISPVSTALPLSKDNFRRIQAWIGEHNAKKLAAPGGDSMRVQNSNDSTVNGVVIGLLSSFGSAILIALVFLIVYFFRYTSSGRIFLDRIGRPGEYDDEQAFAREEAEALEEMDDIQRAEYLRATGVFYTILLAVPSYDKAPELT